MVVIVWLSQPAGRDCVGSVDCSDCAVIEVVRGAGGACGELVSSIFCKPGT
jgi:hypothetical protein